jgi:ABC-2 type transport system permease protein
VITRIGAVLKHRALLVLLVRRDLKTRYADSYLGYAWTILDPLLMALVYFFIFSLLGRGRLGASPYIVFLLTGLLPWNWFTGVVSGSTRAITGESKLVRSTQLPREIWSLRLVASRFVSMTFSLPVLLVFAVGLMVAPSWYFLTLPLAVVIQALLLIGLSLMVSSITVLVNDLDKLIRILLRVAFYLTPIIYTTDNVLNHCQGVSAGCRDFPEWVKALYTLNPMVGITSLYQSVLFPETFVGWWVVLIAFIGSFVVFAAGWATFARLESAVLKEL